VIAVLFANDSQPWPLAPGIVHVWRFACQQDPGRLAALLSDDERATAARFATYAHRDAYVVQHAMQRWLLARYVDVEPARIRFGRGARGKPRVERIEHNLSHCDDVALLAVAGSPLGVDIERRAADLEPRTLGRIVLAPDEFAPDRRSFLRVWCRKEACLKATGVGLVDDLTSVTVVADRVDVAGEIVHVQDLDVGPAHAAALATKDPVAAVSPRELERCVTS
jgi:4'-phosphopantetheinyl transferase